MPSFSFVGNNLALDFVNTERMGPAGRIDLLPSETALFAWARSAGIAAASPRRLRAGDRLDRRARPLRKALRDLVEAKIDGRQPPASALALLNRHVTRPVRGLPLAFQRGTFTRARAAEAATTDRILERIVDDAVTLLTTGEPGLLRRCANHRCIRLFYDRSRGHRRQWCSMATCGNRAKVSRHRRLAQGVKRSTNGTMS